jgi:DNA-binding transcriptional regulator YiaG
MPSVSAGSAAPFSGREEESREDRRELSLREWWLIFVVMTAVVGIGDGVFLGLFLMVSRGGAPLTLALMTVFERSAKTGAPRFQAFKRTEPYSFSCVEKNSVAIEGRSRWKGGCSMGPFDEVLLVLKETFPGSEYELIEPIDKVSGRWILDFEIEGFVASLGYFSNRGYFLVVRGVEDEVSYGMGFDEALPGKDQREIGRLVAERLKAGRATLPPREVQLREIRQQLGLTQGEVAERLGVQQAAVSKLERRPDISVRSLEKLVEAMGGSLELWIRYPGDAPILLA